MDAALERMTTDGNRLRKEVARPSFYPSQFSAEHKMTCGPFDVITAENGTVRGQFTEQQKLKEEVEQKATDIRDDLDGVRGGSRSMNVMRVVCRLMSNVFQGVQNG